MKSLVHQFSIFISSPGRSVLLKEGLGPHILDPIRKAWALKSFDLCSSKYKCGEPHLSVLQYEKTGRSSSFYEEEGLKAFYRSSAWRRPEGLLFIRAFLQGEEDLRVETLLRFRESLLLSFHGKREPKGPLLVFWGKKAWRTFFCSFMVKRARRSSFDLLCEGLRKGWAAIMASSGWPLDIRSYGPGLLRTQEGQSTFLLLIDC